MSARDTALSVLIACRRQGAWSDGALRQRTVADGLDRRDAALAARLCYGVLQNRLLLDHWIGGFVKGGVNKLQPVVLDILRLGLYQIRFTDKIPPSAAVNEAVAQARRLANPRAAGLVNAVLRNMLRQPRRLELPDELWLRYSHPKALTELLEQNVGAGKLEPLLRCHNAAPETAVQVNTVSADPAAAEQSLLAEGYAVTRHPWLPDCLLLKGGSAEHSAAWREGQIYVQDPAARLAVLAAGPEPGQRILDCCAAPGGKSFAAAVAQGDGGEILSCDIHSHKLALIERSAARLGLRSIRVLQRDASRPDAANASAFDTVLCDVPCSGLGVIRKKPDIRYKDLAAMERLPALQRGILDAQAACVRPGGVLLYSTCTILCRENEDVVSAFLQTHPDFSPEPFSLPGGLAAPEGQLTLLPCDHGTDGFFIAKLRRRP